MKVLVITPFYKPAYVYGGPVRSVSALSEGMAQAGAQVTVLTTDADGLRQRLAVETNSPIQVGGVKTTYFSQFVMPLMPLFFYSPALGRACREQVKRFDAVYLATNWNHPTMMGARAALDAHIPYVFSPRGCFMSWSMQQLWLQKRVYLALIERRLMDGAAAIHCTSQLEEEQLGQWHFRSPTFTVPNSVNTAQFEQLPARGKLRQSFGIPTSSTVSLFVGRLHKMKRIGLMIRAFARAAAQALDTHLVIAGPEEDGSGQAGQKLARSLGLADRVHFVGLLTGNDLMQAYVEADLLVLLSLRENFGMVVAEAMAAGLPVLVSRHVALAAEVEQARTGRVVVDDEQEISAVWQHMLDAPDLRRDMGARGQALVRQRFSPQAVAGQMLEHLRVAARQL